MGEGRSDLQAAEQTTAKSSNFTAKVLFEGKSVAMSEGEKKVAKVLRKLKIRYRREKTFPWLINARGNNLRFDFWLPKYKVAIEYDGIFHYTDTNQKRNDRSKNACCKKAGVRLLRIPYWQDKYIELLITDFLFSST